MFTTKYDVNYQKNAVLIFVIRINTTQFAKAEIIGLWLQFLSSNLLCLSLHPVYSYYVYDTAMTISDIQ